MTIDIAHPRKSVCNCPFAEGRRVICKHMVALDLGIFPEKEQQMMDYIEEQNQLYEQEYLGLGCVQSVYRWLDGINIPTVDNLYALSELLQVPIDAIVRGNTGSG